MQKGRKAVRGTHTGPRQMTGMGYGVAWQLVLVLCGDVCVVRAVA
jgi:hypothetical protein